MSSTVTGKGVPVKAPSRASRSSALRFVRMAVAFVVVAGSLGLATVTATAQNGGSSCPSDGAAAYSDVPETSFAYDDSRCLRELGISDAGDTYRPGDDMTRSEMAAFMANAYAVLTGMEAPIEEHMFEDIEDDPNADDIARISPNGLGITRGTTDTTYSPGDPVIRGHMALFLTRLYAAASGGDAPAGETEFTDIGDLSDEEQAAIGQIFALGITTGTTSTTYSPTDNVTRAQMASFVARMYRAINDALADAPAAPTGVEVAVSGDDGDALDVSWDASDGADSYVVQWKSGEDDYSADNQRSVDDGTSTSFDDLTQGTTYTFRVAAVGDAGQGGWSDEASASPAVAPGMVGDLKSTPGNGSLTLSWSAPEDDGGSEITGYVVSWRTGRQATADTADVAGDATEHTITGLDNSKSYSVWVAAMNAAGTGEAALVPAGTDNKDVSPTPTAASAPQNLTVSQGATAGTSLAVTWTEPADDGGTVLLDYTVERRCGDTTAWGNPQSADDEPTMQIQSAEISGLTQGEACEIRVRANSYDPDHPDAGTNAQGSAPTLKGPWAEASGTPVTLPGAPGAAEVTPAHESLQITWAAPNSNGGSEITGYKIMWTAGIPAEATVAAEPRMYTITGLDNRYTYSITIKTITAVGESATASPAATGSPAPVPAAPTNVQAAPPPVVAGESHDGTALVVTWGAPPANGTNAVTGYTVEHRTSAVLDDDGMVTSPAGAWSGRTSVAAPTTTHTFTSLTSGTAYDVRVRALNDNNDPATPGDLTDDAGGPYGQGSGTPATVPGVVPSMVSVPGYTSLDVSWGEAPPGGSDITHYLVRIAANVTGNEPYSADVRVDAPLTRVRLTGLAVGVPHTVQIQAVNGIGTGLNADFGGTTASPDATFRTGLVPEAPTSVTAAPKTDGDGSMLTVTWSSVTRTNGTGPVASYVVETLITAPAAQVNGRWAATPVADATATTADVASADGNSYMVRVRAVSSTGANGSWGYIAEPVTAAGVPDAPENVMADVDSTTTSTVNVTWNSVPEAELDGTDITGYVVSWYETANPVSGSRGSVSVSGAGTGTYAITGLAPGTYTISVVAVNHVGKSPAGSPTTAPEVPQPS